MIVFPCHVCKTELCAEEGQVGKLVRCPECATTMHVPAAGPVSAPPEPSAQDVAAAAAAAARARLLMGLPVTGKRYGFNCGYCSSRLEAHDGMAAQQGQCPTCGNQIIIPILDRYGRLIDPVTQQIIRQDPHPVHSYAAAGERAPRIVRMKDGSQSIQCPRCSRYSPITANNCKSCYLPFTIEGTTTEAAGAANGYCVASLVLGIIGLPASCTIIVPMLAVIFGIVGAMQVSRSGGESGGKYMAIIGAICGGIGTVIGVMILGSGL